MQAIFLTYNSVGKGGTYQNGVLEQNGHQAIVVQHPQGKHWAIDDAVAWPGQADCLAEAKDEAERSRLIEIGETREGLVQHLYNQVFGLPELPDYVVLYVGAAGSEGAIRLASLLPKERVRFILCDCNLDEKFGQLRRYGMDGCPYLMCNCGGQSAMERVLLGFLQNGTLGEC